MAENFYYSKFAWNDWANDPDLRRCSKAAKGVWMDALAVAWNCPERGVFATGGRAWIIDEIAAAIHGDTAENLDCLKELAAKNVLRQREDGAYFNKRMNDEYGVSLVRAEAGRVGGSKLKANAKQTPSKSSDSVSVSVSSEGDSKVGASAFDRFWSAWPKSERKIGKRQCLVTWRANNCDAIADKVMAALDRSKKSKGWRKDSGQFVPMPRTWLNQTPWLTDSHELSGAAKPDKTRHEVVRDHIQSLNVRRMSGEDVSAEVDKARPRITADDLRHDDIRNPWESLNHALAARAVTP